MRPSELKQLSTALGAIREELISARATINESAASLIQQEINQQEIAQEQWTKTRDVLARPRRIDPEEQISSERNQERRHRQNLKIQILLTVGTWLAFAAAAIYAAIAADTYVKIGQQTAAAQNTLSEVQKQTSLMQTQVEASMAAVLSKQFRISWPKPEKAYLNVVLDNRGRVVASKIRGDIEVREVSFHGEQTTKREFPAWKFTAPDLNPSGDLPLELGTNLGISEDELSGATAMPNGLQLTGTITYFNGFRERSEEICYYIPGKAVFRNKAGVIQQSVGENPITCGALPDQIAGWRQTQAQIGAQ